MKENLRNAEWMRSTQNMKNAIRTKFHGPTNYRDSRVTATSNGHKLTMGWNHDLNAEQNHRGVAVALAEKLDWHGRLVGGALSDSYVFVFAD